MRDFLQAVWRLFLATAVTMVASANTLPAQQESAIHGVVVEESAWQPIPSAQVTLIETGDEARTGQNGTFVFRNPPLGHLSIRVETPGFPTMVEEVEVTTDAMLFVQFLVPQIHTVLDELFVIGRRSESATESGESQTAADLLTMEVRGIRSNSGVVGDDSSPILLRGISSISLQGDPVVYVDGVRMGGGIGDALRVLAEIPASDVEDIEVLRGPTGSFARGGAADGVIEVRTKSGLGNP